MGGVVAYLLAADQPAVRRQIDQPDPGWLERLGQIAARTLVLAGGPHSHVPQDGVAELARRVPGGRLVTVPVGHLIHRAAPEAFTGAVSAFLAEDFPPAHRARAPPQAPTRGRPSYETGCSPGV